MSITLEPEEVDFRIEKEGWNIYDLDDGTVLKVRPLVVKIFTVKPKPPERGTGFGIAANNVVVAKAIPERKGTPLSEPYPPDVIEKAEKTEIPFKEREEVWNSYLLPDDKRLKVRIVVTSIVRAEGLYDQFGNPIYLVRSDNIMRSEPVA